ncbi:MAG: Cpe/LpqF family protein [Thermomicrobiales bacterium]
MTTSHRIFAVRCLIVVVAVLVGTQGVGSSTPSPIPPATPSSSPAATPRMPSGALGAQILWMADAINFPDIEGTPDRIALHIAPSFLALVPIDDLTHEFAAVRADLGMVTTKDVTVTSRDYPPSIAQFTFAGTNGGSIRVQLSIDPASRLIDGLFFTVTPEDATSAPARQILGAVLPDGPLGLQMEWLLGVLNDPDTVLSDSDLAAHFSASFLNATPPDTLRSRIESAQAAAPLIIADRLVSVTMNIPPSTGACVLIGRGGESFRLVVTIAPRDGRIASMVLTPVPDHGSLTIDRS